MYPLLGSNGLVKIRKIQWVKLKKTAQQIFGPNSDPDFGPFSPIYQERKIILTCGLRQNVPHITFQPYTENKKNPMRQMREKLHDVFSVPFRNFILAPFPEYIENGTIFWHAVCAKLCPLWPSNGIKKMRKNRWGKCEKSCIMCFQYHFVHGL